MKTMMVVVGFLGQDDRVLMVRRAPTRRYSPNLWEPIGAFVRRWESAEDAILRKTRELTGMDASVSQAGRAFECEDAGAWWVVKPYLLEPARPLEIALTPLHSDFRWVTPAETLELECIDGMREDFEALGMLEPTTALL